MDERDLEVFEVETPRLLRAIAEARPYEPVALTSRATFRATMALATAFTDAQLSALLDAAMRIDQVGAGNRIVSSSQPARRSEARRMPAGWQAITGGRDAR